MWLPKILISLLIAGHFARAEPIKIAILDNLQSQRFASEKYQQAYFKGIEIGIRYAKIKGLLVETRHFEYGKGELDILTKTPKVLQWNPDVVIGPRSSGKFLLLKDQFPNVLTLSPLATSTDVAKLPNNFFSITHDNREAANAMAKFVRTNFKGKTVFAFTEADCKSCTDYTSTITQNKDLDVKSVSYLGTEIEKLDSKTLVSRIRSTDLILLSATSYSAGVLLGKIVNEFPANAHIFLGNDEWGSFNSSYVGKVSVLKNFTAYRIVPWSLHSTGTTMSLFKKLIQFKDQSSIDEISFISFSTVKVIVDSYFIGKSKKPLSREAILTGLRTGRERNSQFGRSSKYSIFRRTKNSETFLRQL